MDPKIIPVVSKEDLIRLAGYCNFSQGAPDNRWRGTLNRVFGELSAGGMPRVGISLSQLLFNKLTDLGVEKGFGDTTQAREVLELTTEVLNAYLIHHGDLLHHLAKHENELLQPFFLARVIETILVLREERSLGAGIGGTGEKTSGFISEVLRRLNDFLGYRPLAVLETRHQGEPYANERHRPVPVWLRDVGGSWGDWGRLVNGAVGLLAKVAPSVLGEAGFDLSQVDEIAVDMRAYDHGHPANLRPNHVFGEWDPGSIDSKGRYSRLVLRRLVLQALGDWRLLGGPGISAEYGTPEERDTECAAVLAGTLLMSCGLVGGGPGALDSSQSLSVLVPRVARLRDQFYHEALRVVEGPHRERLETEARQVRQPFGRVRHFLNAWLARNRALQLQQRCLALVYARLGFTAASRQEAEKIDPQSHRLMSRVLGGLRLGEGEVQRGQLERALVRIDSTRLLLQRGIRCGAFADPWNVLGFQGMFPLGNAREDATRDHRIDELLAAMELLFQFGVMVWGESAAAGNRAVAAGAQAALEELAAWWDPHATYRVSDARPVRGALFLRTGERVAEALGKWHDRGEGAAELEFWKKRVRRLNTPQAYCLVLESLFRRKDLQSAQGLLVHWVSRSEKIPLEDSQYSFESMATRFLVMAAEAQPGEWGAHGGPGLVTRFLDLVRANAGSLGEAADLVPGARSKSTSDDDEKTGETDFLEAMPSWDEGKSGGSAAGLVEDEGFDAGAFDLEDVSAELERKLEFQTVLGKLTSLGVRLLPAGQAIPGLEERLADWQIECVGRQRALMELALRIHGQELPSPSSGEVDALMQFERRRSLRERLTLEAVGACLEQQMASMALRSVDQGGKSPLAPPVLVEGYPHPADPQWTREAVPLERAVLAGRRAEVRECLPRFCQAFQEENLLYTPLSQGGTPEALLRTRTALSVLRALLGSLPRLGLLSETLQVLRMAHDMEIRPRARVPAVTEFVHYFQAGLISVVEAVVRGVSPVTEGQHTPEDDKDLVETLEGVVEVFERVWVEHSRSGQMSPLENLTSDKDYADLRAFIQAYGNDLFHTRFMTLANLRGILHRGAARYLEDLHRQPDTYDRIKLVRDIEAGRLDQAVAGRRLELILRTLVENYEEFKDYNTTTTLSDYGQNLHILIDFLALKARYERRSWELRPQLVAHEQLARLNRQGAALLWAERLEGRTQGEALAQMERLAQLEQRHAARLGTIRDRVEERFVKSMALDRICALVQAVHQNSREWLASDDCENASLDRELYSCPALASFQAEVDSFAVKPVGVGRDIPEWLRRIDTEIQRVQLREQGIGEGLERVIRVPCVALGQAVWREEVARLIRPLLPPPKTVPAEGESDGRDKPHSVKPPRRRKPPVKKPSDEPTDSGPDQP